MKKVLLLGISHLVVLLVGFGAGIYALPILTAPQTPPMSEVTAVAEGRHFKGEFRRDLADSDAFHWGEGDVFIGDEAVSLAGRLAPGPDYKLYLSPEFVETEADFNRLKPRMSRVGDVRTFENFVVPLPESVDPEAFNTVIVWCESFGQFITSAQYQ